MAAVSDFISSLHGSIVCVEIRSSNNNNMTDDSRSAADNSQIIDMDCLGQAMAAIGTNHESF